MKTGMAIMTWKMGDMLGEGAPEGGWLKREFRFNDSLGLQMATIGFWYDPSELWSTLIRQPSIE